MPKGNHVFNHYNKTLENAFAGFIIKAGITTAGGAVVNFVTAKGAPGSADGIALASKLPKAWAKLKEIIGAPEFTHWDTMQDDEQVEANDPNSTAYGKVAKKFVDEFAKIAVQNTRSTARPGAFWQEMVNVGFDQTAATNFIGKGNGSEKRKKLVDDTKLWVRGPLFNNVAHLIQYAKLDMDGKK